MHMPKCTTSVFSNQHTALGVNPATRNDNCVVSARDLRRFVTAAAAAGWIKALKAAELEFGDSEELVTKLEELIEAAPEAEDDSESD